MSIARFLVTAAALSLFAQAAVADDVSISHTFTGVNIGAALQVDHNPDADPWKGYFTATVTNNSGQDWGDFHFQLIRNLGFGTPSLVVFDDTPNTFTMTGAVGYSYVISPDLLSTDFYFYGDPVAPTESVTFTIYTDNTANQQPFGMLLYPTPVPEPAALGLLALGALVLLQPRRH